MPKKHTRLVMRYVVDRHQLFSITIRLYKNGCVANWFSFEIENRNENKKWKEMERNE